MPRVLVTGANGFLAGNTIAELLRRGYHVRGMLRKTAREPIIHADLDYFYGNITEKKDVVAAARGCDSIIHIAALTDQSVQDYKLYEKVNITGTRYIVRAALEQRVKSLIYISTVNAFGYGTKSSPGVESMPMRQPFTSSGYAVSKAEAQKLILNELANSGITATVVNPSFMIGPNDNKISSNRIILRARGKRILFIPPGGKNFIHVMDAARGICNAMEQGKNGECYILANENLTYREFYKKMSSITGEPQLLIKIPGVILLLAGIAGNIARYAGINTELSLTNMKILCLGNYYSSEKAVKKLNLQLTPVDKAIEETLSWFGK